jgi:hypothetical protein
MSVWKLRYELMTQEFEGRRSITTSGPSGPTAVPGDGVFVINTPLCITLDGGVESLRICPKTRCIAARVDERRRCGSWFRPIRGSVRSPWTVSPGQYRGNGPKKETEVSSQAPRPDIQDIQFCPYFIVDIAPPRYLIFSVLRVCPYVIDWNAFASSTTPMASVWLSSGNRSVPGYT